MKVNKETAEDILNGDSDDWEEVKGTRRITDQRRWVTVEEAIFKNTKAGKFYRMWWEFGSTEQQDQAPFEYEDEVELREVEEREVLVKQWVPVEEVELPLPTS